MSEKFKTPERSPEPNEVEKNLAEAMTEALSKGDFAKFNEIADLAGDSDEIVREPSFLNRDKVAQETDKKKDAVSTSDLIGKMEDDLRNLREKEEEVDRLKISEILQRMYEHFGNENEPFYTNTKKGSGRELFFRVIQDEHPDFGVEVVDDARIPKTGEKLDDYVAIYVEPYKGKRDELFNISRNPIIETLTTNILTKKCLENAQKIEDRGDIPSGTIKKLLARRYKRNIEDYKKIGWTEAIRDEEKRFEELGGIEPFSDEELRSLVSEAVRKAISEKEE